MIDDASERSCARASVPRGTDAKAEAENLPFARHHDFAPMTSPPRVAFHSTDRKPNSGRASRLITATTACQVKFHREHLRPTHAGHACENWMVVIAASYHGKSDRSVTCCPPPGHRQPSSACRRHQPHA